MKESSEVVEKWKVVKIATVRKKAARDSAKVGKLEQGAVVDVLEKTEVAGQMRVLVKSGKISGWTSVQATNGDTLLIRDLDSMGDSLEGLDDQ